MVVKNKTAALILLILFCCFILYNDINFMDTGCIYQHNLFIIFR
jgi:hypothetical protein